MYQLFTTILALHFSHDMKDCNCFNLSYLSDFLNCLGAHAVTKLENYYKILSIKLEI